METRHINLEENCAEITARSAMLDGSKFMDVSMRNIRITDADLSDLHIEGAQLGGAYFENIGLPPEDHPGHDPALRQRPLTFRKCDLNGSTFDNCDLSGVEIVDCDISGLKINGVLIQELFNRK
ncbi:pentapeptide repeat-containing protein [Flavobacterium selenitireducens]|uniref:pentapeptide repeat-containing protein n=1 Tax=Flavobacterium selenitireducens TaxID=2722704 RepID=UPI00168A8285|nr:pentapeptide repeat-containing protein [Flavobacterium selenitireducens]MBD3583787.1 pentapeptide repeat-containing protein [Flavobacterium selenitireducens]